MSNDVPPPHQPPNQPPGEQPYANPYGQAAYGQPQQPAGAPAARAPFDPSSVNRLDWAILAIGLLVFVFSFFDYYSWDFGKVLGINVGSVSWSAWHFSHGLFIAWFAMVFSVVAAVILAVELFVPTVNLPKPGRVLTFDAFAVSFVLYLIAIFAHSDFGPAGGHAFSFWFSLVLSAVGTLTALVRAQQTGTALPGPVANLPRIGG
ncbi:hypothetical protein [Streptomyces sp. HPF1205]|uniref:hypothetical protein n=1 Tax=Streptomyces sp. HPF1205 TaxID=2873262 RepID=UPI001CECA30B|nr:hypothetical protein [Streptomyces sp. HPF1205]